MGAGWHFGCRCQHEYGPLRGYQRSGRASEHLLWRPASQFPKPLFLRSDLAKAPLATARSAQRGTGPLFFVPAVERQFGNRTMMALGALPARPAVPARIRNPENRNVTSPGFRRDAPTVRASRPPNLSDTSKTQEERGLETGFRRAPRLSGLYLRRVQLGAAIPSALPARAGRKRKFGGGLGRGN